jgi:hypothetical protein
MPVHALHVVMAGTTSRVFLVHARDAGDRGRPRTGLGADDAGAVAAYLREGDARPTRVPLVPGELGRWEPGGFAEVDPELVPGMYQFGAPDEMLAPGSPRVLLTFGLPGADVEPVEIDLVAFDPQDEACIGMAELSDRKRHKFLRAALPRMTEDEFERGAEVERELTGRIIAAQGS